MPTTGFRLVADVRVRFQIAFHVFDRRFVRGPAQLECSQAFVVHRAPAETKRVPAFRNKLLDGRPENEVGRAEFLEHFIRGAVFIDDFFPEMQKYRSRNRLFVMTPNDNSAEIFLQDILVNTAKEPQRLRRQSVLLTRAAVQLVKSLQRFPTAGSLDFNSGFFGFPNRRANASYETFINHW